MATTCSRPTMAQQLLAGLPGAPPPFCSHPKNPGLPPLAQWSLALPALAVSGATDWADGWAARRFNQPSVVGSYLDPLADKVLICSVVGALGWSVSAALPSPSGPDVSLRAAEPVWPRRFAPRCNGAGADPASALSLAWLSWRVSVASQDIKRAGGQHT